VLGGGAYVDGLIKLRLLRAHLDLNVPIRILEHKLKD